MQQRGRLTREANEKQLLSVKPLYLLVDGRENHNAPQTESTKAISCLYLAEVEIPKSCCCCVRPFRNSVGRWCWEAGHGGRASPGCWHSHLQGRGAKS